MNHQRLILAALAACAAPLDAQTQASTVTARRIGLACHELEAGTTGRFCTISGPAFASYTLIAEPFPPADVGFAFPTGPGVLYLGMGVSATTPVVVASGVLPATGTLALTLPPAAAALAVAGVTAEFQVVIVDPLPAASSTGGFHESNTVLKTVVPVRPRPDLTAYVAAAGPVVTGSVTDIEQWDVDADGDLDTITLTCGGTIQIDLQQNGALVRTQLLTVPGATAIEGADFDNDGLYDMVASVNGGPAVVFQNGGHLANGQLQNGRWGGYRQLVGNVSQQGFMTPEVTDVETADFNGDGFIDFVVSCADCDDGAPNRIFFNSSMAGGPITFGERTFQSFGGGFLDDSEDIEVTDLDGDGDFDLVVGNFDGPAGIRGMDFIWVNAGGGVFAGPIALPGAVDDETLDVCVGDIDGDGRPDIYVGNWFSTDGSCGPPFGAPRRDRLYLSQGAGGVAFTDRTDLLTVSGLATSDVEMADHDLDGDIDIFVAHGSKCIVPPVPVSGLELLMNQRIAPGQPNDPIPLSRLTLNAAPIVAALQGLDIGDLELGDYQTFWWDRDIGIGHTGGVIFGLK